MKPSIAFGSCLLVLTLSVVSLLARRNPEVELLAVENGWNNAELKNDAAALSKLMADDLVLTETDGSVINKAQEVAYTADPDTHFEILESHDLKIQVHGDAAVVTGEYHEKGSYRGQGFEHRGRFTDTWIRQNGIWQCIAGHFSIPVRD